MAFWRAETLSQRLPNLIDPYDPDAIDCAAYTLHVGNEVYVSPDQKIKNSNRHTKQRLDDRECFTIPPGQFGFLMTRENVSVPNDALAFLSIKARTKFSGLINISGFHVDPGYNGKLLFSVLNAGPKPLHIQAGQPLFLIWYADLDGSTENKKKNPGFKGIEPEMINPISGEILSLQSLSDKQSELDKELMQQKIKVNLVLYVAKRVGIALVLGIAGTIGGIIWEYWSQIPSLFGLGTP